MTYEEFLLALVIWREARGEPYPGKCGVAWSVKNRAAQPKWWGNDIYSVVTKSKQYSSFNAGDVNSLKFPAPNDPSWGDCVKAATDPLDPTNGATSYYDTSIDPPGWTQAMTLTTNIGKLRFYK